VKAISRVLIVFGIVALALVPAASDAAWIRVGPQPVGCSLVPPGYRCSTTTQIRFAYPRRWDALDSPEYSSMYTRLIWLSTQELNEPCSYTHTDQGVRVRCGLPLGSLNPNAALLQWGFGGRPGWSLGQMPGEPMRIGGRAQWRRGFLPRSWWRRIADPLDHAQSSSQLLLDECLPSRSRSGVA
jgi:hypothetical protein